ncbi:MAG: dephospho-CoA kinase, partial [Acidimicrobiaceae bacterium]|nr:dephospho-CoA kinase [Acidimicrobiaceae bacterium]
LRGAELVDADAVAREVVRPGGPAYEPIVRRFGAGVLAEDGTLDRAALARIVFSDPAERAALESITHPAIGALMRARVAALEGRRGVVILDVPLLDAGRIEAYGLAGVIVVDLPEEEAVARLVSQRGFTEADARARVAAQMPRTERRRLAELKPLGAVIDNSGDRQALEARIDEVWSRLQEAAGGPPGDQAGFEDPPAAEA